MPLEIEHLEWPFFLKLYKISRSPNLQHTETLNRSSVLLILSVWVVHAGAFEGSPGRWQPSSLGDDEWVSPEPDSFCRQTFSMFASSNDRREQETSNKNT